jgi:hypothetical protein
MPIMQFSRVTVSTLTFDLLGYVSLVLLNDNGFLDVGRRVSIVPTLDGGVAVDDGGATDKDRVLALSVKPKDRLEAEQLQYLTLFHPRLRLGMQSGCFQVVPLSVSFTDIQATWNLRVIEKLA